MAVGPRRQLSQGIGVVALSYRHTVERALDLLGDGMWPYVDRRMTATSRFGGDWLRTYTDTSPNQRNLSVTDPSFALKVMIDHWDNAFANERSREDKDLTYECRKVRNRWAHPEKSKPWTAEDAYRALGSIERLLVSVDASEVVEVKQLKTELIPELGPAGTKPAVPEPLPDRPVPMQDRSAHRDRPGSRPSKYDPLRGYLTGRGEPVVRLSFVQIEHIIGAPLADSARDNRQWWANVRSGSHVQAAAWMGAGRRTTNVDFNAGTVDFVRSGA